MPVTAIGGSGGGGAAGEAVNAQDYGAVGNGTTDDTAAIQAAITAAGSYGSVYIPGTTGGYKLTAALVPVQNQHIYGSGRRSTWLHQSAGNLPAFGSVPYNVRISDLGVDAATVQTSGGGGVVFASNGALGCVERVCFGDNLYVMVDWPLHGQSELEVRDCLALSASSSFVSGVTYGFRLGDGTAQSDGIHIRGFQGRATSAGVGTWAYCRGVDTVHVSDSMFYGGTNGLNLAGGVSVKNTGHKYDRLILDSLTGSAVSAAFCRDVLFQGCAVQTCGATAGAEGIAVGTATSKDAQGVRVVGCNFQNNQGHAVRIYAGSEHTLIADNAIYDGGKRTSNTYNGVDVAAGGSHFTIQGNEIGAGTNVYAQGGSYKYGVSIGTGASDYYRITGNRIIQTATGAIYDGGSGSNKIVQAGAYS